MVHDTRELERLLPSNRSSAMEFEAHSYAQFLEEIETKSIVSSRHDRRRQGPPKIPHLSELFVEGAVQAQYPHRSRHSLRKANRAH
jgi:hypothetical protein